MTQNKTSSSSNEGSPNLLNEGDIRPNGFENYVNTKSQLRTYNPGTQDLIVSIISAAIVIAAITLAVLYVIRRFKLCNHKLKSDLELQKSAVDQPFMWIYGSNLDSQVQHHENEQPKLNEKLANRRLHQSRKDAPAVTGRRGMVRSDGKYSASYHEPSISEFERLKTSPGMRGHASDTKENERLKAGQKFMDDAARIYKSHLKHQSETGNSKADEQLEFMRQNRRRNSR